MSNHKIAPVSDVPPSHARSMGRREACDDPSLLAGWVDRLHVVLATLPVDQGVDATLKPLVDELALLLPDHAFVLRLNPADERTPGLAHATTFVLDDAGAALLVGHSDALLLASDTAEGLLLERAAALLRLALHLARANEQRARQADEVARLQAQVIQAGKLASLGEIAAGVVHELNNPITSIVAYSDLLLREAERGILPPPSVERLRRIAEAAERIRRFSRELIAYARPSSGVLVTVAVHDIVDQAILYCEHAISASGVQVTRGQADQALRVSCVPADLTQVFVNLITNACQAMPAGGSLALRAEGDVEWVRVSVIDSGTGIEASLLPRVFDPFFTTKGEGVGTGLGLSIVKNIVERHRGHVHVESSSAGTSFTVQLPRA